MREGSAALMGRESELERLAELLANLPGANRVVVLRGEAGVGKTSLLDELGLRATALGITVLQASGVENEAQLTFSGLHQLLYPVLGRATELDSSATSALLRALGRESGAVPDTMTVADAVLALLVLASGQAEILLLLDDVQWLDRASADILVFVLRRLRGQPVEAVLSARTGMETAFDGARFREIDVLPLEPAIAANLLTRVHPGLRGFARTRVLADAQGNPLAIEELPRALGARQLVDGLHAELPLTRRLETIYASRVDEMSAPAREKLLSAALDAAIFDGSAAAGSAAIGGGAREASYLLADADEALRLGLVVADASGTGFRFRHPLVRSGIAQRATAAERRDAHLRLAELFHDDVERHAWHLAAAATGPEERAALALVAAATHATLRGASGMAVAALTRAAELSPGSIDRSRRLADAAYLAGQSAQLDIAQELLDESRRGATDPQDARAAAMTSAYLQLYRQGDVGPAHRTLLTALQGKGGDEADDETLDRMLNVLVVVSLFAGDAATWRLTDAQLDRFGVRVSSTTRLYRDAFGDVAGSGTTIAARLDEHFARVRSGVEPWNIMRLLVAAYFVDRLWDYRVELREMVERESDGGAVTTVMTGIQLSALDLMAAGDLPEAERAIARGLDLTAQHGYTLFNYQFRGYQAMVAAMKGEFATAERLQIELDRWARPRGVGMLVGYTRVIAALRAIGEGRYEDAWTSSRAVTAAGEFTRYSEQAPRMMFDLVEAAVRTGRMREARAHALAAEAAGFAQISPRLALLTTAGLAMTSEGAAARGLYEEALAYPGGEKFPFDLARIRLHYGGWLRRERDSITARIELRLAVEEFAALGTSPWERRAALELRAAGDAGSRRAPTRLTPQELEIAGLAAQGMSNKQIGERLYLSPRTVSSHLYKIFPKLGVTSRSALRDALSTDAASDLP